MLSALAKYIFGGVVGDAPETTSMHYETREINDWLLVDMPDQDIDNEDMGSDSDEDDILSAVPLLLAEDISVRPRQIVLSYEPDTACDKSYAKIRKGFQDKIPSPSPKVQVHTGDKIQGNFVANVEAISLETGDTSNDKVQHNLSQVQENTKAKQSKSKNLKSKKSKKNKINKKCIANIQDTSVIIKKKCINDVQKNNSDNIPMKLKSEIQSVSNDIIENLGAKNDYKLAEKIEDNTVIINNSTLKNISKGEENSYTLINDNSNHKKVHKIEEDSQIMITDNSSHKNQMVHHNFFGKNANKVQENASNEEPNNLDKKFQLNSTSVENNLRNVNKRSYADVVKARSDILDKDCNNKEVLEDKTSKTESESSEVPVYDKTEDIKLEIKDNKKSKSKKNKAKKYSKNKILHDADMKSTSAFSSNRNESQGNMSDNRYLADKNTNSPQIQENSDDEIENSLNGKNVSNKNTKKINIRAIDAYLSKYDNFAEALQNSDKFFEEQNIDNQDFTHDIFSDSYDIINDENITNFINSKATPRKAEEITPIQNSKFEQNLDDRMLENIADLWDIYTKIQDNSDDEVPEISHEEINDEMSDKEMNEISDEQITDDEMNENSQDEYEEISDDESHGRFYNKIFQNVFGEQSAKHYNRIFEYSLDEESEESDDKLFISNFFLPPVNSSMEIKSDFLQPFKCNFFEELKENVPEIPKHHSSCVPLTEYELVEYFNSEPQYFYACQSLQYPSSYALAIAEYYSNHVQYFPKYSERCNAFIQKYKKRETVNNQTLPSPSEASLITNTAELLETIINQKCPILPTKTAVVLEHVKDLKPVQQAIQYEARKYLTRSQLNRQNRNYIYQSSSKNNRRRNLQRNHSGVNNNRKCC